MTAAREQTPTDPDRILVGVDFSEASLQAARWVAHHLAPDASIDLVHAVDLRKTPRYLSGGSNGGDTATSVRDEARDRLRSLGEELGTSTSASIEDGRPHRVLPDLAAARGADLLVVAASSERRGDSSEPGRTARRLVNTALHPLLLVRGAQDRPPSHVLVAVDDSPETRQVLSWARRLRDRFGGRLTVLHVFHPVYAGIGRLVSGNAGRRRLEPEQREQARAWLEEEARAVGLTGDGVLFEIAEGDPEAAILEAERRLRPDLLVLGSHGAGTVERAIVGSTAAAVAEGAGCSVLLTGGSDRS